MKNKTNISFRRGTVEDFAAVYKVYALSVADFIRRLNLPRNIWEDPEKAALLSERRKPLFEHLARNADQFWVAEDMGQIVGYARSIITQDVQELTELFVHPDWQSVGVGSELLKLAFPADCAQRRVIVASSDIRARTRYLKSGVYPYFNAEYFYRQPEKIEIVTDLNFQRVSETPAALAAVRKIDNQLLEFERGKDHEFLMRDRRGYLYCRNNQVVGYGYLGKGTGPIALLNSTDFPVVLAHAETDAAEHGEKEFGVILPLINQQAVNYLFQRNFQMEGFVLMFMCNKKFGKFENYIFSSPPFFI